MIYALRRSVPATAYCILPITTDRTDDSLGSYGTYYAEPYATCGTRHQTKGYNFVYDETVKKHSLQSFTRTATCVSRPWICMGISHCNVLRKCFEYNLCHQLFSLNYTLGYSRIHSTRVSLQNPTLFCSSPFRMSFITV